MFVAQRELEKPTFLKMEIWKSFCVCVKERKRGKERATECQTGISAVMIILAARHACRQKMVICLIIFILQVIFDAYEASLHNAQKGIWQYKDIFQRDWGNLMSDTDKVTLSNTVRVHLANQPASLLEAMEIKAPRINSFLPRARNEI